MSSPHLETFWTKIRNMLKSEKAQKLVEIQCFLKKNVEQSDSEEWQHFFKFKFFFVSPETQKTLISKMLQFKNSVLVTRGGGGKSEMYYIICD